MASVYEEITRLETAKKDIKTAIETCGVNVSDTKLISNYASYIRQIPSAVFSQFNAELVGGEDNYIKTIEQIDGKINATTGGLVSSDNSGLAPKIDISTSATISTQANEWVLTSTKGGSPTWRKLPINAFKNDNTTYSAGAGISLSGTTFVNAGVRSIATGNTNGTISVNTNGTTTNVAVKGLGNNAYTSTAYLPLEGGIISNTSYGPLTIERKGSANMAAIKFKNSSGALGSIGMLQANGNLIIYNANATANRTILDSGNSSVSGGGATWGSSITVKIGDNSQTLTIPSNPNTWRNITNSYSGTDTTISLSQKGANDLYNALVNGYASSAGDATTSSQLSNISASNPASAASSQYIKWYSAISNSSGYAGNNYGFPVSNNANGILWMGTYPGPYGGQLGISSNSRIYYRFISNNSFPTTAKGGSWKTIAWTSDIPTTITWNNIKDKPTYYWANVPVSTSSSTTTAPKFSKVITSDSIETGSYLTFGYHGYQILSDIRKSWRSSIYGNTTEGSRLKTVRTDKTINNFSEQWGSGLAWAAGDTHGYLSVSFGSGKAWIGGGNGNTLNWSKNIVTSESINNIVVTTSLPSTKVNNTIYILI